jgi:hypothetical protein
VKVHCDEGLANHIGPEPCAGVREDTGEASAGDRIGQPLSREIGLILGADAVLLAEGNMGGCVICECPSSPARSETLACADAPCAGTGRSHVRPGRLAAPGPHRKGEEP